MAMKRWTGGTSSRPNCDVLRRGPFNIGAGLCLALGGVLGCSPAVTAAPARSSSDVQAEADSRRPLDEQVNKLAAQLLSRLGQPAEGPQQLRVASLPLEAADGTPCPAGAFVADMLAGSLLAQHHPAITEVVERHRIDAILTEQDFGQQGRIDPAKAAAIGKLAGATAVTIGNVSNGSEGHSTISIRLISTDTGTLISTASIRVASIALHDAGGCGIDVVPAESVGSDAWGRQTDAHKVFLSTSVVGFITAAVLGAVALGTWRASAKHCPDSGDCDDSGNAMLHQATIEAAIAAGGLGLGIIGISVYFAIPPTAPEGQQAGVSWVLRKF
jgi:hypothetical protein